MWWKLLQVLKFAQKAQFDIYDLTWTNYSVLNLICSPRRYIFIGKCLLVKCKYKICGWSKYLPLTENIWTFETDGNEPGRGDKHVWDHVVMGKQSQDGSGFFWKFWASQCVSQNSLFVKLGLSPPSEGHDMWMLVEHDKQKKGACGVQVKVSKLYNNCILRGAIYVSRKNAKRSDISSAKSTPHIPAVSTPSRCWWADNRIPRSG